jgi:pimeloyl-ACP methyl ester carboxylesterase
MPGLGSSDSPDDPWTLDVSAKIIADGIETLLGQNEQFALVGFSAGAMVSGLVSERLQSRCRCLVIVGAGGLGTARHKIPLEKVRSKQGEERRQAHFINLSRLLIADSDKIDEQAIAIQDWNSTRARVNSAPFSLSAVLKDALARSNVPLKAIWGSADAPALGTLEERCSILRQLRPSVEIAIIPGAGHWVAYEAADAFNTILIGYLKPDNSAFAPYR